MCVKYTKDKEIEKKDPAHVNLESYHCTCVADMPRSVHMGRDPADISFWRLEPDYFFYMGLTSQSIYFCTCLNGTNFPPSSH